MAGLVEVSPTVEKTLENLNLLITEGNYAEASRLCFKAIKCYGDQNLFYRAKCYSEMKMSRWNSCLETIGWLHLFVEHPSLVTSGNKKVPKRERQIASDQRAKGNPAVDTICAASRVHIEKGYCAWLHFEQAYCYYKLGKFDRALHALKMCSENERPRDLSKSLGTPSSSSDAADLGTVPGHDIKLDSTLSPKHSFLLAQIYVRLGHFDSALSVYKSMRSSSEDPLVALNTLSVGLNMLADLDSTAQRNLFHEIDTEMDRKLSTNEDISYEFFYNWAIAKILEKVNNKAEEYLDLAEQRLSLELKDELGDDHRLQEQPEFAGIEATRVYLLGERGCNELAQKKVDSLRCSFFRSENIDPGVLMVILSNWVSLAGHTNIEDLRSAVFHLEALLKKVNVICKFTQRELLDIHCNIVTMLLSAGDSAMCKAHIMKFVDFFKRNEFLQNGLASVEYAEGRVDSSISVLKRGLSINRSSIVLMRSLLGVLLAEKRFHSVLRTAQMFADELITAGHSAFYWGAMLQCYIHLNQKDSVVDVLSKLLDLEHSSEIAEMLQHGCQYLESQGMHPEAKNIYSRIYEKNQGNTLAYYGVIFNESFMEATEAMGTLDSVSESLFKELRFIDAEELETEGKLHIRVQASDERKTKKTRRRRRAAKVDTSKGSPDPERWLPKYERAAFKKLLKRRKDMTKGNTQGSTNAAQPSKPTSVTISTDSAHSNNRRRRNRKK